MTAQLNHTFVYSADRAMSARFLAEILGLPAPVRFGPFEVVELIMVCGSPPARACDRTLPSSCCVAAVSPDRPIGVNLQRESGGAHRPRRQ
jgi:hypothetical protein